MKIIMRLFPIIILCVISTISFAQSSLDTRIIVTVSDSLNLYEKVRLAFVNEDFIVKDDRKLDSLTTYPMNISSTTFIRAYAAISSRQVIFWGYLGDSEVNFLGYTVNPSKEDYKKIFYYKSDKYWKKLRAIASRIEGTISYGKE